MDDVYGEWLDTHDACGRPKERQPEPAISFTVEQLEAMLAAAKAKEAGHEGA